MDEHNPYEPPREDPGSTRGPYDPAQGKLFTVAQVMVATLLGSILAGTVLMAFNERVLNRGKLGKTVLVGTGATVLLFVVVALLPERVPGVVPSVVSILGMQQWYKQAQQREFDAHTETGGAIATWWIAVGAGLLFLGVFVALFLAAVYLLPA